MVFAGSLLITTRKGRKDAAVTPKDAAAPKAAIMAPAIVGPIIRERLNWACSTEIALPTCRRSTISTMVA